MHRIAKPSLCKSLAGSHKVFPGLWLGWEQLDWLSPVDTEEMAKEEMRYVIGVDLISQVWCINVQVLQYEEAAGTWSEIGKMEKARDWHGVVEIDSSLLCSGIVQIVITHYHHHHYCLPFHHLFILNLFVIQAVSLLASFNLKWYLNDFKLHPPHSSCRDVRLLDT